jgi:hypothetical protein
MTNAPNGGTLLDEDSGDRGRSAERAGTCRLSFMTALDFDRQNLLRKPKRRNSAFSARCFETTRSS